MFPSQSETQVADTGASGAPVPPSGQGEKDTVTLSRAEVESLRRERDEARQSERYWAERARGTQPPEPATAEPEEFDNSEFLDVQNPAVENDTPEKLVDEFAAKGVEALTKRGFVTAADAQRIAVEAGRRVAAEMISRERQKMGTDAQIMGEFPELRDQSSELFKETAKRYQKAVAFDPGAKKTPAALYLAAEAARDAIKARDGARRRDDDDPQETEAERRQRASSQDGRHAGRGQVVDDDLLGDEAKQVIAAMGITPEEFKASRQALGVRSSRGRR